MSLHFICDWSDSHVIKEATTKSLFEASVWGHAQGWNTKWFNPCLNMKGQPETKTI